FSWMIGHDRRACKPSSLILSKRPCSSRIGRPHSVSKYSWSNGFETAHRGRIVPDVSINTLANSGCWRCRVLTSFKCEQIFFCPGSAAKPAVGRSEEHTSELQSRFDLVCRL